MKRFTLTFLLALSINLLFANLLYDITDGRFRAKSVNTPRSMNDGENFSLMPTSKAVVKYNL